MRTLTRPSTARCTLIHYVCFLLAEPLYNSCCRLAQILMLSHDSCNRFLLREEYTPYDLYRWAARLVTVVGGVVSVDDTVLDKPYSFLAKYVGFFWSGKHKRSVKGINLITLYYTDVNGVSVPGNYRLYDKEEGKTKNDYFRDMLAESL